MGDSIGKSSLNIHSILILAALNAAVPPPSVFGRCVSTTSDVSEISNINGTICPTPSSIGRNVHSDSVVSATSDIQTPKTLAAPKQSKIDATRLRASDFYFGKCLGEGAYARVVHAMMKGRDHQFAIKIMEKMHIKKENKVKYVMNEKTILSKINHPFVIRLYYTFQDTQYLYMCMELAPGGHLLKLIMQQKEEQRIVGKNDRACSVEMAQFYTAEIVEALEYLHGNGIIHRDMKPENLLIAESGHIKVADFGTALQESADDNMSRSSFVGTAEYVSPEVLHNENASKSSDLWALGCIVYQMLTGTTPFQSASEYLTFQAIMQHCDGTCIFQMPSWMDDVSRDLIMQLMEVDPMKRLGAGVDEKNGYISLKGHAYFSGITWNTLIDTIPPYIPDPATFPSTSDMRDGASDEWIFEGEATPLQVHGMGYGDRTDGHNRQAVQEVARKVPEEEWWKMFLLDGEQQVFTSIVWKRKGLFSKRRQLVLTDRPRLIYADPETMTFKGEIPWDAHKPVSVRMISAAMFDVYSPAVDRSYHLTDTEAGSQIWVDLINALLQKQTGLAMV